MRIRAQSFAVVSGILAIAASAVTMSGCDDDAAPSATPDAGLFDVAVVGLDAAPSEAGPGDSGAPDDAGADAGGDADAQAQTNDATWSAASGLPSAACSAWTLVDTSPGHDPAIADGVMTVATDNVGENMYWSQGAADLIMPPVITMEARLRLLSGSATQPSRAPASILVRYGNPLRTAALYIASGEAFLNSASLTKGPTSSVATTDAPHTYRLLVDTTTHAITVERDGASILTGTAYLETEGGTTSTILFGEASILAKGSSEWTSVAHNAHALSPCP